jgi:hypothetical protein
MGFETPIDGTNISRVGASGLLKSLIFVRVRSTDRGRLDLDTSLIFEGRHVSGSLKEICRRPQ